MRVAAADCYGHGAWLLLTSPGRSDLLRLMEITLLYFDDCPHWREADAMLTRLARERTDLCVTHRTVDTDAEAERLGFRGSPTILIDGIDPWVPDDAPIGLSCRVYMTPDGARGTPTWDELLAVVNAMS